MANDTSVSEFCTEQGIWASIKPLTLRLYVNPEGQLRAQGCARSSWAADGRHSWLAALRRHKSQFGMQIRSSGDRTDRQIAYRRISPPTGLDPGEDASSWVANRSPNGSAGPWRASARCSASAGTTISGKSAGGSGGSVTAGSTTSPSQGRIGSSVPSLAGCDACGCARCADGPSEPVSAGGAWCA